MIIQFKLKHYAGGVLAHAIVPAPDGNWEARGTSFRKEVHDAIDHAIDDLEAQMLARGVQIDREAVKLVAGIEQMEFQF